MRQRIGILLVALLAFGGWWLSAETSAAAQSAEPAWQPIRRIEEADDDAHLQFGVTADNIGQVHLFWTQQLDAARPVIYYKIWDGVGWSPATDIIVSPFAGSPRYVDSLIDETGRLHLLYQVGNGTETRLVHQTARIEVANSAQGWQNYNEIADGVVPQASLDLVNGALIVVYGKQDASIETITSTDFGFSWSEPLRVSFPKQERIVSNIRSTVDGNGRLHVTWSNDVVNVGVSDAVEYLRFDSAENVWDTPIILAARDPGDYEADWAELIAVGNDEVIFIVQDGKGAFRNMRRSTDGGETWGAPERVFDLIGENGLVAPMTLDGGGNLHAISHGRYTDPEDDSDEPDVHGLFYVRRMGDSWGERSPIQTGKLSTGFDPQSPKIAAFGGNKLLVLYGNDPHIGLFYTFAEIDAPAIAPQPYPTVTPQPTSSPIAPTPTPTPIVIAQINTAPQAGFTAINPLFMGAVPAIFLLGVAIAVRQYLKRQEINGRRN